MPVFESVIEHILEVDVDARDRGDLQDILPSGVIDIQCSWWDDFSIIQEEFCFYGLDVPVGAERFSYCRLGA